jgi:site-specific DNA recombinase
MSKRIRCAIYTRKSTEEGLEQDFNSLDAQREACEAYIQSQRGLGWVACKKRYDDGGLSGGTMDRPALKSLLADIDSSKVDLIVVYKVDRLTRSLMDFSKIIENLDARDVSFVSVTQQFNTANSMGRLTLNVLLSFAQFEREVTAERIRDKIAASKKKGMWMGGLSPLGYDAIDKKLVVNRDEAQVVRTLFDLYLQLGSVRKLKQETDRQGLITKKRKSGNHCSGGLSFSRGHLYQFLHNPVYVGLTAHKGKTYPGQHDAIIEKATWDAAQKMLDDQAPARISSANTKQESLLTGLVFDERGDRLSPSHSKKDGRRYRYYISNRLMQGGDKSDGWRIPADQLERAVLQELSKFLENGVQVANAIHGSETTPEKVQASIRLAANVSKEIGINQSTARYFQARQLIDRVDFSGKQLRVQVSLIGLSECIGATNATNTGTIILNTPITFRRRGVESKIILSGASKATLPEGRLIDLVSNSYQWAQKIFKREVSTVREISREKDIDEGDVSRFLPLAFLAPDIVEAILKGRQPAGLTSEKLKRLRNLPKSWEEQRKLLKFTS